MYIVYSPILITIASCLFFEQITMNFVDLPRLLGFDFEAALGIDGGDKVIFFADEKIVKMCRLILIELV